MSSPTTTTQSPAVLAQEDYSKWSVGQLLREAARRPSIVALFRYWPERPSPTTLPMLLHLDDGEHLADRGHYEKMSIAQLKHQVDILGLRPSDDRMDMVWQLWILDEQTRQLELMDDNPQFAYPSPESSA